MVPSSSSMFVLRDGPDVLARSRSRAAIHRASRRRAHAGRNMTLQLGRTIPVPAARRVDLSVALSPEELRFVETVATGGRVYANGIRAGTVEDRAGLSCLRPSTSRRRRVDVVDEIVDGGGAIARRLVRAGWFRFHHMGIDGDGGYFWLTVAAERVWQYRRVEKTT